jgi:hypothetical protein
MATTAVAGVVAAGRVPVYVIPAAAISVDPATEVGGTLPLADFNDAATVKIDCHMDAGDMSVTSTPTTRQRQRLCQIVSETISTATTIDVVISAVYDQQEAAAAEVNEAYTALVDGAEVYIGVPYGWDSSVTPTTATVTDLYKGTVQTRVKNFPTTIDEDLKFTATISASAYFQDVELT